MKKSVEITEFRGFAFYIDRTLKALQNRYISEFRAKGIDLTIEQWVIMLWIQMLGEKASQSEISKTYYRNRATTSRVISGLCSKGLVIKERFKGDQKRFKLRLTKEGQEVFDKAMPINKKLRVKGKENIEAEHFDIFLQVLGQIFDNYYEAED